MSDDSRTHELLQELSAKLNVLISLSIRQLPDDGKFEGKPKRKGIGDQVRFLANMGLDAKNIAEIIGAPLTSVRTLLTPSRRK